MKRFEKRNLFFLSFFLANVKEPPIFPSNVSKIGINFLNRCFVIEPTSRTFFFLLSFLLIHSFFVCLF